MKATQLIYPTALSSPVAYEGDKNTIPLTNDNPLSNQASIKFGFPSITSVPVTEGGIPPQRTDMNGLFYLSTDFKYFCMAGGYITFNQTVCDVIGGYPQGAILQKYDVNSASFQYLRSLVDDNTYNFNILPDNPQMWENVGINASIPIATTRRVGAVQPDGQSVVIDSNGIISVPLESVTSVGDPIPTFGNILSNNQIWLEGGKVLKETYAQLTAVYGDTYAPVDAGDTETYLYLPDCRDRAPLGSPDMTFGYVESQAPNITGSFLGGGFQGSTTATGAFKAGSRTSTIQTSGGVGQWIINFDASLSSSVYKTGVTSILPASFKVRWKTRYQ